MVCNERMRGRSSDAGESLLFFCSLERVTIREAFWLDKQAAWDGGG